MRSTTQTTPLSRDPVVQQSWPVAGRRDENPPHRPAKWVALSGLFQRCRPGVVITSPCRAVIEMCVRPIMAPTKFPSVVSVPWARPAGVKRPMGGVARQNFLGVSCRFAAVLERAQPRSRPIQAALVHGTYNRAQQSMSLDNNGKRDA
jgi:hypothetical protein